MFIRKYVYQFFFSMAERWGFSKKLYSVPDINCRSVKIQHIKRIVKDIHVFASSFDITDIVENEKKNTITGLRILLLSG